MKPNELLKKPAIQAGDATEREEMGNLRLNREEFRRQVN
jgi:hypothetical protein